MIKQTNEINTERKRDREKERKNKYLKKEIMTKQTN